VFLINVGKLTMGQWSGPYIPCFAKTGFKVETE
jgi:hypothetical protein